MKTILVLSTNPKNTDRLRQDEEIRDMQEALERSHHSTDFAIVTRWALRVDDLQRALLMVQPQIVHFSGHGAGEQGLALENAAGNLQLVSTTALADLFQLFQEQVECVVLNACYSEVQADAIHQHIDCVVGMNQTVGDKAAIAFARGFYEALGAGKSYEEAFAFGRSTIALKSIPETSTPILKYRKRPPITPSPANPLPPAVKPAEPVAASSQNSISIGRDSRGSAVFIGGGTTVTIGSPPPTPVTTERVDIRAELQALRELLSTLETVDRRKIENAIADAEDELQKSQPDKDEVGQALERALNYAQKAEGFAAALETLQSPMSRVVSWLGKNWYRLLDVVRLGSGI